MGTSKYKITFFFLLFFTSLNLFAQGIADVSQLFTAPNGVTRYNIYEDEALKYKNKLKSTLEAFHYPDEKSGEILVLTEFIPGRKGVAKVFFKLDGEPKLEKKFTSKVNGIKIPPSRYVRQTMMTLVKINGGSDKKGTPFIPALRFPKQTEKEKFSQMSFPQQYDALLDWAQEGAIPILARLGSNAAPKYGGVKSVCRLMAGTDFQGNTDVVAITDSNYYYWRGMMEMEKNDQLITISKVMMHVANGDLDLASRYLSLIKLFSDSKTSAYYFATELSWRLDKFYESLEAQLLKGMGFQDGREMDKAIEHYQKILSVFPKSAAVQYELFYTETDREKLRGDTENYWKLWNTYKTKIYSADPLYFTDISARTGREGYELVKRAELTKLFQDPKQAEKDLVKYADIALALKSYSLAAFLYWNCISHFPKDAFEGRNLLKEYLYCLIQMGNERVVLNFRKDMILEARKVEEEQKELMKKNPFYQSFEEKGE